MRHRDFKLRKTTFALSLFLVTLNLHSAGDSTHTMAIADNNLPNLRSLLIHYGDDDYSKYSSDYTEDKRAQGENGKTFLQVFPLPEIAAIEIPGDETRLPSAIAELLLTKGKFVKDYAPLAVQSAPALIVRLKDKSCIVFRLIFDPADMSLSYAESKAGVLVLPEELRCRSFHTNVRIGMTRAEVRKCFYEDGGISVPFRYERYVSAQKSNRPDGLAIKMNFAYKPAEISDAVYYLGKWQPPKQSENDTVVRCSPPYLEKPFTD